MFCGRGNRSSALMCNLYSITRGQEAIRRLFQVARDLTGNLPALPAVYPDTMAPVVRVAHDGERELTMMRWGFPPPPNRKVPVTNVRNVKSPYWRLWLKTEWRCLVPATSFCEWSAGRPKVTHWFALGESRPLFAFAGIWPMERRAEGRGRPARTLRVSDNRSERSGAPGSREGHAGAFDSGRRLGHVAYRAG
jgi:putative SOS response-associated peptidase YedK